MALTFVNGVATSDTNEIDNIPAGAQSHTTGNGVIVLISNYKVDGPVAVLSVTDTAGNTYIKAGTTGGGDAVHDVECWFAANIAGNAANVVTATFVRATTSRAIALAQYSGLTLTSQFDANSTYALPASGTTQTTNGVTTATNAELLIGGFVAWSVAQAPQSTSGGSTLRVTTPTTATIAMVDKTAGAAGSYTTELGLTGAGQYVGSTFAFKQPATGSLVSRSLEMGGGMRDMTGGMSASPRHAGRRIIVPQWTGNRSTAFRSYAP